MKIIDTLGTLRLWWRGNFAITTLVAVAAIAAVAAAGVGSYAAVSQANAQAQSAKYNEETSAYNQKVAQNSALAAQQQGALDAYRIQQQNLRTAGSVAVAAGASGSTGGSAADVAYDDSVQGEMNTLVTQYKSATQSTQYSSQGQVAQQQEVLAGIQESSINPALSGAGAALGPIGQGAGNLAPYFKNSGYLGY